MEELDFEAKDLLSEIKELRKAGALLDSAEFKKWWAAVEHASRLRVGYATSNLDGVPQDDWRSLLEILKNADFSQIEKMSLMIPHLKTAYLEAEDQYERVPREYQFGAVALLRATEFSALKTLILDTLNHLNAYDFGSDSLAEACRAGVFRNLRVLSLPVCQHPIQIIKVLTEGDFAHLTTLSVYLSGLYGSDLDALFQIPCFNKLPGKLQGLALRNFSGSQRWKAFTQAIQVGSMSNIVHLRIPVGYLQNVDLEDLVRSSEKWFSSLKSLEMPECDIRSMQVSLVMGKLCLLMPRNEFQNFTHLCKNLSTTLNGKLLVGKLYPFK